MWKSKLMEIFRALTGTEKRALNKWLRSPFVTQQAGVLGLWEYLIEHRNGTKQDFLKEEIFAQIYPQQTYRDVLFRQTMSDLLHCIEEYLVYKKFCANRAVRDNYLVCIYRDKRLLKFYQQSVQKAQKYLDSMPLGPEFFDQSYDLEYEKFVFLQTQKRTKANNLQDLGDALDVSIILRKLKQSCMYLAHQRVYKVEYDYSFLPHLLKYLEDSHHLENPAIATYYYCYRALSEEKDEFFQKFKAHLFAQESRFSQNESRDLLQLSINYCIQQLNRGVKSYVAEALHLYRLGLRQKLLYSNGQMSRFTYNNIVGLALKLDEYGWAESFIVDYRDYLDATYRQANYNYNLAKLFYLQQRYQDAFHHLSEVDESDVLLNFSAKVILLKMYYELEEYDNLEALLASFRALITRKNVLSYHQTNFSNFIQFTRRLLYLRPDEADKRNSLHQAILDAEVLAEREWLLEQLTKLE